jgi:CheY-like chemotaxis protein
MTFTGRGRITPGPVPLNAVVVETVEVLRGTLPASVAVDLDLGATLPHVQADPALVRQAVANLIVNAIEAHGPAGGRVLVRTDTLWLDHTAALAADFVSPNMSDGEAVVIDVRDTGHGMTSEVRARMFEPFFTTHFRGRGLGLAVVLGVARSHRGAIFVETHAGMGTTVRLVLPATRLDDTPRDPVVASSSIRVVLVVDDEASVRAVTGRMLESAGYRVILATDGEDALGKYRRHRDAVRLVLVDLTMPRLGGEGTFRALRQLNPELHIVLMSGYPEAEAMSRFGQAGLSGFLQKPFRPFHLLDVVRRQFPVDSRA